MPIRIRPIYNLKPLVVNLEGIFEISALIEANFTHVLYSATDEIWEIYDESRSTFLEAISQREKLDSLKIFAKLGDDNKTENKREMTLHFNEHKAEITLEALPRDQNWFSHFLIDLKKHVKPGSFAQNLRSYGEDFNKYNVYIAVVGFTLFPSTMTESVPYCKIIIQNKPINSFNENIKANLVSSLIWSILAFLFGIVLTLIVQNLKAQGYELPFMQ